MTKDNKNWEDGFESLWEASFDRDGDRNFFEFERLKEFVRQLLKKEKKEAYEEGIDFGSSIGRKYATAKTMEEIIKIAEEMRYGGREGNEHDDVLSDLISKLKSKDILK